MRFKKPFQIHLSILKCWYNIPTTTFLFYKNKNKKRYKIIALIYENNFQAMSNWDVACHLLATQTNSNLNLKDCTHFRDDFVWSIISMRDYSKYD